MIEIDDEKITILLDAISKGVKQIRESQHRKGRVIIGMEPLSSSENSAMHIDVSWEIDQ